VIYMVDHVYTDPATEPAWNDWYAANIGYLLSVPGVNGVQRFKAIGQKPSRYLTMYSLDSGDVFRSPEYRNEVRGGGSQSVQFHHAYGHWTRNLFEGAKEAPEIQPGQRVFVADSETPEKDLGAPPGLKALWLKSAPGLPESTPYSAQKLSTTAYRAVIVLDQDAAEAGLIENGGYIYEPLTPVLRPR
jgi:hypothetical protein